MCQTKCSSHCHVAADFCCKYGTPRILNVYNKKVAITFWLIIVIIIGFIIGYAICYSKGYQKFDYVQSAVTTKLKGVIYTNETVIPEINGRIWDSGDYAIPTKENGAFFVLTNVLITPHQKQGVCEENLKIPAARCENATCVKGQPIVGGNGIATGRCINSTIGAKVCEIHAWCPVERDDELAGQPVSKTVELLGAENVTVFIKNNIEFPEFGVVRHNLPAVTTYKYLSSCRYNPNSSTDKFCPIFTLKSIVSEAGHTFESMAKQGGVIQITITWDCNLDLGKDDCLPSYSFRRLDRHAFALSRGHNFRYAMHYMKGDSFVRTLYKAYGILFVITVEGKAGKFDIVPLVLKFGAGIALLSIAPYVCDFIVLCVLSARARYRAKKYLNDKEGDVYEMGNDRRVEAGSGV